MTKNEFIEKEQMNFSNQMDPEMEETRTITEWCIKSKINLLDSSYFDDDKKYTLKEFEERVPREIQIPLMSDLNNKTALDDFAKGIIPEQFAKDYKKMKKLQEELNRTEAIIKEKLLTMFESIPDREQNSVSMDGLKFTYVGPTKRKTVDTKKLEEEWPEIYKKVLRESNVKSQIRTSVEY